MIENHRRKKPDFLTIVDHLNSQEIGHIFTITGLTSDLDIPRSTVYTYMNRLNVLGFLGVGQVPYECELLKKIPDTLDTSILHKLYCEIITGGGTWKDWFMTIDDRIQAKYDEYYGKDS